MAFDWAKRIFGGTEPQRAESTPQISAGHQALFVQPEKEQAEPEISAEHQALLAQQTLNKARIQRDLYSLISQLASSNALHMPQMKLQWEQPQLQEAQAKVLNDNYISPATTTAPPH